jgi:hypothetical protein
VTRQGGEAEKQPEATKALSGVTGCPGRKRSHHRWRPVGTPARPSRRLEWESGTIARVSSAEEFAGSLRAAAVAIHDAQQHVTASRASASASARHLKTALEGSTNAAAQAAGDGAL